jgi:hydroxymethylbilane synthase
MGIFMVGDKLIKKDITGDRKNYILLGKKLAEDIINP